MQYMQPEEFIAYRLLSIGAKLLPVQSMEETQAFTKQVMRQMRSQGAPVDLSLIHISEPTRPY